jgi:hypothetical protein
LAISYRNTSRARFQQVIDYTPEVYEKAADSGESAAFS